MHGVCSQCLWWCEFAVCALCVAYFFVCQAYIFACVCLCVMLCGRTHKSAASTPWYEIKLRQLEATNILHTYICIRAHTKTTQHNAIALGMKAQRATIDVHRTTRQKKTQPHSQHYRLVTASFCTLKTQAITLTHRHTHSHKFRLNTILKSPVQQSQSVRCVNTEKITWLAKQKHCRNACNYTDVVCAGSLRFGWGGGVVIVTCLPVLNVYVHET